MRRPVLSRWSKIALSVALTASALGSGVVNSVPAAAAEPSVGDRVGVDAGAGILWEDDGARQADLDAIAATGAKWFSLDVDWNSVQSTGPFEFDWQVTDRVVREAHARGLSLIGMVGYSPPWARPTNCPAGTTHCLPRHVEDYARFAKAAALRYGAHAFDATLRSTITTWQIWNEPNHVPFVQPRVDVAKYTELLRYAHDEIKKVDRSTVVLAAGTSPAPDDPAGRDVAPVTFLEGIYANGGGDAFDAFAHHPYSFPCSPLLNRSWNAFFQTYWLYQVMVRHGDGDRKVWGTEIGAPTGSDVGTCADANGSSVTEADQARFAVDALRGWTQTFGSFTGPLLWFQIRDGGSDPANPDDHFGLLRSDRSAKLAYDSFSRFVATGVAPPHPRPGVPDPSPDPVPVPAPSPNPPPSSTPVPTPDPVPDPTPPVAPPVTAGACLRNGSTRTVSGSQVDRFTDSINRPTTVDARTATWTQVDSWPISITGSGSVCWSGGTVTGTYDTSTSWDVFHSTGAFNIANPDSVIEDLRIHNYGDGIRIRAGASHWEVRGAHVSYIHDDCVEDDKLQSGVVTDSLFDGCYVGFSTRPTASDSVSDGHANTFVVDGSLVRLRPMPTVYKGSAPGHGGFFKWDTDHGRSPRLVLRNDMFRVDQLPNHGSLGLPDGYDVECSGNTIVWLGDGPFPEAASWRAKCPDTRIVTTKSVWDDAVSVWTRQHA